MFIELEIFTRLHLSWRFLLSVNIHVNFVYFYFSLLYSALLRLPHPQISLCRRMLALNQGMLHSCTLGVRRSLCLYIFWKSKKTLFAEIYQAQFSEKSLKKILTLIARVVPREPVPGVSTEFVAAGKPPPTLLPRAQERLLASVGPQVSLHQGELE